MGLNAALGAIFLLTAPAVLHGLVRLHAAVARGLLVDERSALRARVSELTDQPERGRRGGGAHPAAARA